MTKPIRYLLRNPLLIGVVVLGAALGAASGVLFANASDLPIITELDDYAPETITRVHDRNGEVIGEFATQRRVIVEYDDIPDVLRHAVIAVEDADFFNHVGFNVSRLVVTLVTNILSGDLTGAGASTLTMQLAWEGSSSACRRRGSASCARRTTRSTSRSATRSGRSSRSTATRSGWGRRPTPRMGSRRRRASTSASAWRSWSWRRRR